MVCCVVTKAGARHSKSGVTFVLAMAKSARVLGSVIASAMFAWRGEGFVQFVLVGTLTVLSVACVIMLQ